MNASLSPAYDVEKIRRDFPALSLKVYGKPLVYLDNAASAQKPSSVISAIANSYACSYANIHRSVHFLALEATRAYEEARESVRLFLHAVSREEIVFTSSATSAINTVAYGYAMPFFEPGDQILLSVMEHHSNIVPWHLVRERKAVELVWLPADADGEISLESFNRLLTPRTRLVAITHMSNVFGSVPPVKEMIQMCHQRSVPVLVDGSQAAVHMRVDVQDLGCDFYVFTGHKIYGPTGIGVLYARKNILERMHPFQGGGEMIDAVGLDYVTYHDLPYRFEAGTPPFVQAVGLAAALAYVEKIGRENIAAHEADLVAYAHERLSKIRGLTILGSASKRGPILSFNLQDIHPHDIATFIDQKGVAIRAGTHCAQPLLDFFSLTSACRASFAMYNTRHEIDILSESLEEARRFFGS